MASESKSTVLFPPAPRLYPGWLARAIIAVSLGMLLLVRFTPEWDFSPYPFSDRGFCGIFKMVFTGIASITLVVWFCFLSDYPPLIRRIALSGVLAGAALFMASFRMKEVDGSMTLHWEPRWRTPADMRLGRLEVPPAPAAGSPPVTLPLETTDEDFPQFLGPERSCYLPGPELARDWSTPPKLIWKRPIGAGWSAFAVAGGLAVTMEQRGAEEWISCYDAATGNPVWGHAIVARHEDRSGIGGIGPRSTPTIHQGRVYAQGATGIVRCLDARTGKLLWQDDLLIRYGLIQAESEAMVSWGRAGSPLVIDDLVVVPAGGKLDPVNLIFPKSLIAYHADSGKVAWEAGQNQVSYASPMLATLAGVRQVVIVSQGEVTSHDPATGEQLWTHPWPGFSTSNASSSQAVQVGSDRLLLSKGYGQGAELLTFEPAAGGGVTKLPSVWVSYRVLQTKFTNVTIIGQYIYGLSDGILECVDLATGQRVWKKGRYGHGQILGVGGLILVQGEEGEVALVEANPAKYVELGRFQALDGKTWNNLCLAGSHLFVRNAEQAACYELPLEKTSSSEPSSPIELNPHQ